MVLEALFANDTAYHIKDYFLKVISLPNFSVVRSFPVLKILYSQFVRN